MNMWMVLGIEETKDKDIITNAYREKLSLVNPEEDSEGFMRLRSAYEEAMQFADKEETNDDSPMGIWIKEAEAIYKTYSRRISEEAWSELLENEVCYSLDSKEEARNKLLAFLMDHYILPQKVWKVLDNAFDLMESKEELYEIFPKDFIDYGVVYNIVNPDTIDFEAFDEIDDSLDYESYINLYLSLKRLMRSNDREEIDKVVAELENFDIEYPYFDMEKAVLLLRDEKRAEALDIMGGVNRLLPNNKEVIYLMGVCYSSDGKAEEALTYYERILNEMDKKDANALGGKAYCLYMMGEYEKARDIYADILDADPHNMNAEEYYNKSTEELVKIYTEQSKTDDNNSTLVELAWCQMQTKRIKEALDTISKAEPLGDKLFRYYNILAHCHALNDDMEKALKYFTIWREELEKLEDDGTEETKKHLKRHAYTIFRQGCCYTVLKDTEKALEYIDKSIEMSPNDIMFRLGKASLYLDQKDYTKVVDVCDEAIKIEPENGEIYGVRLRALYELGYYQECFDDCNQCISYTPFFLQAYIYKIKVLLVYDEYEESKNIFDYLKDNGAVYDDVDVVYGEYLITNPDCSEDEKKKGREIFEKLVDKYTDMDRKERNFSMHYIYYMKAAWSREENKSSGTILYFLDKAIEEKSDYIGAYYFKGRVYGDDEETEKALEMYNKVLELNPNHYDANRRIAEIYDDNYEYDKALQYHTAQLENEQSLYYFLNRGLAYMALDRFDEARADYEEGKKCDPDNPHSYNNIGVTYQYENNLEKAVESYLEAIERIENEPTPVVYRNMVTTLNRLGRHLEAVKYHDIVYEKFNNPYDLTEKAMTLRYGGEFEQAIEVYKKWDEVKNNIKHTKVADFLNSLNGFNGTPRYLGYIGECYMEAGDFKKAKKYLKAASDLKDTSAMERLAFIYMFENNYNKALRYWKKTENTLQKHIYLATCYNLLGKKDKAGKAVKEGFVEVNKLRIEDNGIRTRRLYLKGALYLEEGSYDKALEYLTKTYNSRMCNSCDYAKCHEASFRLGKYYEIMKDYDKALQYYIEAMETVPYEYEYKKAVEDLKKKMKN